jgi:hypothetical protein
LEGSTKIFDQVRELIEARTEMEVHVIQNLHTDAGDQSGTQLAVADGHGSDAHVGSDSAPSSEPSHVQEHHVTDDGSASA